MESIDPYLKTLPEFMIFLPIRCFSCGYVLGKYQEVYERLVAEGTSAEEMFKLFNIPIERTCCRTRITSPEVIPYNVKPITSLSVGREDYPQSSMVKRIYTTKTFDDVSNKRNHVISDNLPKESVIESGNHPSSFGVFEIPKPQAIITQQGPKQPRSIVSIGKSTPIAKSNVPAPLRIQQIASMGRAVPQPTPLKQISPINPIQSKKLKPE